MKPDDKPEMEKLTPVGLEHMAASENESFDAFMQTDEAKLANEVWSAIASIVPSREIETIFYGYYTQVATNGGLALESLMRHHGAQAYAMLRNTSESICIALYCLHEPDASIEIFKVDRPKMERLKTAAFAWLEAEHKDYSDYHQTMKKEFYHKFGSHVSVWAIAQNFQIADDHKFRVSYLDQMEPVVAISDLLLAVEFLVKFLEFMVENAPKAGLVLPTGLPAKAKEMRAGLERLRTKNEPAFRAHHQQIHARKAQ